MRARDFTFNTEASTHGLARALITAEDDEIFIKPKWRRACVFLKLVYSVCLWFGARARAMATFYFHVDCVL